MTPAQGRDRLNAYLDGTLDPAAKAEFERALQSDLSLRAEVDLQREIDASLGRLFAYEAPAAAPATLKYEPPAPSKRAWVARIAWLASAAAVALGVFSYVQFGSPSGDTHPAPAAFYATVVDGGWKPSWACENEEQFARAVANQFQLTSASLVVPFDTPGVQLVGWCYANSFRAGTPLSERSLMLLTNVDGKRVLVVMDRIEKDRALKIERGKGLSMFRREIGGLVLYEVTPLDAPRVLDAAKTVPVPPRKPPG